MPDTRPTTRPPSPERLIAEFRPSGAVYARTHGVIALLAAAAVLAGTVVLGAAAPWVWALPLVAALAVIARAMVGRGVLAGVWRLTDRRLTGPGGVDQPLTGVADVRPALGSVVVQVAGGGAHVIRHMANPGDVVAKVSAARTAAKQRVRGGPGGGA